MTHEEKDREAEDRTEPEREEAEDDRTATDPAPPPEEGRTPPHGDPLRD